MPITIGGLSDLNDMLKNQSVRTAKRWLLQCAEPAAHVVEQSMQATAPAATHKLENEITHASRFSDTGLTVRIGPSKDTFYGTFQEFGTRWQGALHWMARAWEACQDRCLSVFGTEAIARLQDMENRK